MFEPMRDRHGRIDVEMVALNGVTLFILVAIIGLLICVALAALGVIPWGWSEAHK